MKWSTKSDSQIVFRDKLNDAVRYILNAIDNDDDHEDAAMLREQYVLYASKVVRNNRKSLPDSKKEKPWWPSEMSKTNLLLRAIEHICHAQLEGKSEIKAKHLRSTEMYLREWWKTSTLDNT